MERRKRNRRQQSEQRSLPSSPRKNRNQPNTFLFVRGPKPTLSLAPDPKVQESSLNHAPVTGTELTFYSNGSMLRQLDIQVGGKVSMN